MDSFTLSLTKGQYQNAVTEAAAAGIEIAASGSLPPKSGVQLNYTVKPAADGSAIVAVMIVKKPFFVSIGMIEEQVKQMLGLS